jgi:hypothetical protein
MRPKCTYKFGPGRYNYDKDKILHKQGEWSIRECPKGLEWLSYIHHRVDKNIVQQNPWLNGNAPDPLTYLKKIECEWSDVPVINNQCTRCRNTIPDGIVALWTLHNFDVLHKDN